MISDRISRCLVAGLLLLAAAGTARAACPQPPQVPGWSAKTHDAIVEQAAERYGGNWDRYVAAWAGYRDKVNTILAKGKSVKVGRDGTLLKGRHLADYAGKVEKKLSVIRCLAERTSAPATTAEEFNAFETASGFAVGTSSRTMRDYPPVDVRITSSCVGSDARFLVTNTGGTWPSTSVFSVHRQSDRALLYKSKIRINGGQTKSFTVKEAGGGHGLLSLKVTPTWSGAGSKQAAIKCN